jgi:phosphatidylglycerol---prolipoprotein diacylglyceryl transferase
VRLARGRHGEIGTPGSEFRLVTGTQAAAIHAVFEWAGIFVGVRLYLRSSRTSLAELGHTRNYAVIIGCIAGAALGNKAVHWLQRADQWALLRDAPWLFLQGQSIVGGLLGGLLGVEIAKRLIGSRESTGDRFVTPILVGLIIGRIGCSLAGLYDDTYGIATRLPWGVDLGDGVRRHPTAAYDMLFAGAALIAFARWGAPLERQSGLKFKLLLAAYLAWRLVIDGLKPVPYAFVGGLSGIQLVCAIALLLYLPLVIGQLARLKE